MVEIVDEEQQFVEDLIRENKITDQKIFENEALERFENRLPCGLHVSHGHIIGVSCYYDFPDSIKSLQHLQRLEIYPNHGGSITHFDAIFSLAALKGTND